MSNGAIRKTAADAVGPMLTLVDHLEAEWGDGTNPHPTFTPSDDLPSSSAGCAVAPPDQLPEQSGAGVLFKSSDPGVPGGVSGETPMIGDSGVTTSQTIGGAVETPPSGEGTTGTAHGGDHDGTNVVSGGVEETDHGLTMGPMAGSRDGSDEGGHPLTSLPIESVTLVSGVTSGGPADGNPTEESSGLGRDGYAGTIGGNGLEHTAVLYGGTGEPGGGTIPSTEGGGGPQSAIVTLPLSGISGPDPGHSIDLAGVSFAEGGSAQLLSGNVLQVVENGTTYNLQLDPSQNYSGDSFQLSSDGTGGTVVAAQSGLSINLTYDQNTLPTGFVNALNDAVAYYKSVFDNPVTLNIDVGYGEVDGTKLTGSELGSSETFLDSYSYSSIMSTLKNDAQSSTQKSAYATLPTTSPDGGTLWLSTAQELALGLTPESTGETFNGYVGFSSSASFSYAQGTTPGSNQYYFIGVAEHEISEVMGRLSLLGGVNGSAAYSIMDLFRYSQAGTYQTSTGGPAYFSIDHGQTNLDNWNTQAGGDLGDWATSSQTATDSYDAFANIGVINTVSSTDLTLMNVLGWDRTPSCFMTGTMIRTPHGETAVDALKRGDLVLTIDGGSAPVRWIGRQTVSTTFGDPLRILPIRIKMGALGDNVPSRDLLLSPDHAVLVDEVLVHAGALVNGISIVRETNVPQTFTYNHVELDEHSLILAENTPAETFVDNVDRLAFDNWDEHAALYPNGRAISEMTYPRAKAYRQVPRRLREQLADRAEKLYGTDRRRVA